MIRMISRVSPVLAMLVVPVAVVGIFANSVRGQLSGRPDWVDGPWIDAPSSWVPFQARLLVTHPDGNTVHGRFFRGADGSDRLETGPSINDIRVVSIKNVRERVIYLGRKVPNTWERRSWEPPFEGAAPMFKQGPNWTLHPFRFAIRKGESGSLTGTSGFAAYAVKTDSGILTFRVPVLNFFEVIRQRPDGRYEAYSEIEFTDQPMELFSPPPGGIIVDKAELRPRAAAHGQHP
jgi:hypothetical protein